MKIHRKNLARRQGLTSQHTAWVVEGDCGRSNGCSPEAYDPQRRMKFSFYCHGILQSSIQLLCCMFLLLGLLAFSGVAHCQDYTLTVAVLVDSSNPAGYNVSSSAPGEYQRYPERYLEHLQVPYKVFDVATQSPPADFLQRQLILIGHSGVNLSLAWQQAIINAVAGGTGLVNLDWDPYIGYAQYVQTIFGATGSHAGTPGTAITVPAEVAPSGTNAHFIAAMQRKFLDDPPGDFVYNFHPDKDNVLRSATCTVLEGATGTIIARIGSDSLILAKSYGLGRAVHFGTLQYLKADRFGFLMGIDDLFWRSLVWAARKPFVMRGYPRYMAVQMDDTDPDWGFRVRDMYDENLTGKIGSNGVGGPWKVTGFIYTDNLVPGSHERASVVADIQQNKLQISPHTFSMAPFGNLYWDIYYGELTDDKWLANLDSLLQWKLGRGGNDTIPAYSKHWVGHYWDISDNTGYDAWNTLGFRYVTSIQRPGFQNPDENVNAHGGAERMQARPFRVYEQPPKTTRDENYPLFFADDYTINSRDGFPAKTFFLLTTQLIDWTLYPRPDFIWPSVNSGLTPTDSVEQLKRYVWRFWSSLAPVQIYTHDSYNYELSSVAGRQFVVEQASVWLREEGVHHIFMDDLAAYACARTKSVLTDAWLSGGQLHYRFTGNAVTLDSQLKDTQLLVFQSNASEGVAMAVGGFTGGATITLPVPAPAPTITGITPTRGSFLGDTSVTITGSNFVNVTSINIGGNEVNDILVNSTTSITFTTPSGTTGPASIEVVTETGTATLPDAFLYLGPPVISGVDPDYAPLQGGTQVTITGHGFEPSSAVHIGSNAATGLQFIDSTTLTAIAPAGNPGTVDVRVDNSYGSTGLANSFSYLPLLFSDDFNDGNPNGWNISPLDNAAGWSVVDGVYDYNGTGHTQSYTGDATWRDYTLTVDFQLSSVENYPGGIRSRVNPETGSGYAVWLYPAQNTVRLFKATAWHIDGPGLALLGEAAGIPFDATNIHQLQLKCNGTTVQVFYDGAQIISTSDGSYSAGIVALDVSNQPIQFDNVKVIASSNTPSINAISPASGPISGGTPVEITGTGFTLDTTVTIGGVSATNVVVNSFTSISMVTPPGTTSQADVTVQNTNGTTTLPSGFTYYQQLLLSGNFDDGNASGWTISPLGNADGWSVVNEAYTYDGRGLSQAYAGDPSWTDYTFEADIRLFSLSNYPGGVRGRMNLSSGAGYAAWLYPANGAIRLYRTTNWNIDSPGLTLLGEATGIAFSATNFHKLQLEFNGTLIRVYYDGALVISAVDGTYSAGAVALDVSNQPIQFDNVRVLSGLLQPVIGLTPNSLTFSAVQGETNVTPQTIAINNLGGAALTWSAQTDSAWLSAAPAAGTAPSTLTVSVDVSGLSAGTYHGSIAVSATGASNIPQNIPVVLTVGTPVLPTISGISPAIGPTAGGTILQINGSGFISGSTVSIRGVGATQVVVNSFTSMTAVVSPGTAGLADVVVQTASGAATLTGGFRYVPLLFMDDFNDGDDNGWMISPLGNEVGWSVVNGVFTYNGTGHTQVYTGDPSWEDYTLSVDFKLLSLANWPGGIRGRVDPRTGAGYAIWLYPQSGRIFLFRTTGWNIDSPGLLQLGTAENLAFDTTGFHNVQMRFSAASIEVYYDGALVISAVDGAYSNGLIALDVSSQPIQFDNVAVSAPPIASVSPTSLTVSAVRGNGNPLPSSLSLANIGGGTMAWTAQSDSDWLSVGPGSGTAPSTLTVGVNISSLAEGTYNGTITVSAPEVGNSPLTIPVVLTVLPPPVISVDPASLNFKAMQGATNPASQNVSITNVGNGSLVWAAQDDAAWLTVSSAGGTAPSTVTAAVNISGLTAGTYYGTITVSGAGAANSPLSIPVTLTVTPPPPAIGLSPTSLSFSASRLLGGNPASQSVTITNTGGGSLSWTVQDNANWLSVTPSSGTAPSTLTVSVNKSGLAVGTYTATITVTSLGASNSPRTIPVTLTVRLF